MKTLEFTHTDVAVLTKVNELAARYGFKPSEFTTSYRRDDGPGERAILGYELVPDRDFHKFDAMVQSVCGENMSEAEGTVTSLIDRLDEAIRLAPASMQDRHGPRPGRTPTPSK